ncbi:dynamin family protein [Gracilibacillus alcaliphilus]|uniref:dynamin family protein n=1 Tax=Gracilibacillus alcaliphilus TaxID=1401441 RepID=UPI001956D0C3|nr:dynamin family protein [Gracilibacillus alcaliphilus]MBM7676676.1 small GTP-binding protein [Gracilibacillus alcaliphilus]
MQITKQDIDQEKLRLAQMFDFFQQQQEDTYKEQILDYFDKLQNQMLHICFSGHFSAGKSTLINHLMEEALLPQSPIPTSANIVEIKRGEEAVIIHFAERPAVKMETLPPLEQLHQLCRDGDEIKKVEIFKELAQLPQGVSFMDTPGIDAANDADRLMTESALHKVDVLFYIMDYNHVQSEVNAKFLKQIDEMNKPYYVVINQMDKHDEEEISFTSFQASIDKVFQQWQIKPVQIFYTSMQQGAAINQLDALRKTVFQLMTENHQQILAETINQGVSHSVTDFIKNSKKALTDRIEMLDEAIAEIAPAVSSLIEMEQTYQAKLQEREAIETEFLGEVEKTTKNAQLVPFEIRERAEQVLQAYDPKFKLGLFRNQKKIQTEREQRLSTFYQAVKEKTETNLEWKLRDKLLDLVKPYLAADFSEAIFSSHIQPDDLVKQMNEGATVNGEYLLVYTENVAQMIKKVYRQHYKQKWHSLKPAVLEPIEAEIEQLQQEIEQQRHYHMLREEKNQEELAFSKKRMEAEAILSTDYPYNESLMEVILEWLRGKEVTVVSKIEDLPTAKQAADLPVSEAEPKDSEAVSLFRYDEALSDAEQAFSLIESIQGLEQLADELQNKQARLKDRSFTIALFGAFSAGKSSFANALIGEKVLPVSPNPTTAAINKISPVRAGYQHKDVHVVIKDEQELTADINEITRQTFDHIKEAYRWVKKTNLKKLAMEDQHKSFLTAFYHGFEKMEDRIGTEYVIDFDQFQQYIRDEEIACFVKEMELFYQSDLTDKQITLVDTPGADSVNARHTDLAFSYIKDADAILFVTYYNHPFSKPDQQFLERLGKVKDAFELDKMFFIINAIDLAKDVTEAQLVQDYIRKELQTFDIQNPRMYAVSSKQATDKKTAATGLPMFEQAFFSFIKEELSQMSMRSIYTDLSKALGLVSNWLSMIDGNEHEKAKMKAESQHKQEQIQAQLHSSVDDLYIDTVQQQLHKQAFYAIQRLSIQYQDVFKDFVHPGMIQSPGRKGKKELEAAILEVVKALNTRLTHEYEAITIRLEQVFNQAVQQWRKDTQAKAAKIDDAFSFSQLDTIHLTEPVIGLKDIRLDEKLLAKWVQAYKDTKLFFAHDGRKEVEEGSGEYLQLQWKEAVQRLEKQLGEYYKTQWQTHYQELTNQLEQEVVSYYHHLIAGMEDQAGNKETLQTVSQQLTAILAGKENL